MSDKTIIGWKIYYGDGSVVSSKEISWQEAKSDDVQVLIVYYEETYKIWRDGKQLEENYRDMYFGKDYYWQFGNGQAHNVPEDVDVKLGKELEQAKWRSIYNRVLSDIKL